MSRTNNKITPLYFLGFVCLIFFIIVFGLVGVARGVNMGSNLNMQGAYKVLNLPTPTNPFDAATKSYVDSALGGANLWAFSTSYSKLQPVSPDGPTLDFCIDQIDSYGKSWIGIGTDNPQYKLDVYGQIRNTAGMISDAITINTAGAYAIDSSGSADVRLGGGIYLLTDMLESARPIPSTD